MQERPEIDPAINLGNVFEQLKSALEALHARHYGEDTFQADDRGLTGTGDAALASTIIQAMDNNENLTFSEVIASKTDAEKSQLETYKKNTLMAAWYVATIFPKVVNDRLWEQSYLNLFWQIATSGSYLFKLKRSLDYLDPNSGVPYVFDEITAEVGRLIYDCILAMQRTVDGAAMIEASERLNTFKLSRMLTIIDQSLSDFRVFQKRKGRVSRPENTIPDPVVPAEAGIDVQHDQNTTSGMDPLLGGDDNNEVVAMHPDVTNVAADDPRSIVAVSVNVTEGLGVLGLERVDNRFSEGLSPAVSQPTLTYYTEAEALFLNVCEWIQFPDDGDDSLPELLSFESLNPASVDPVETMTANDSAPDAQNASFCLDLLCRLYNFIVECLAALLCRQSPPPAACGL